MSVYTLWQTNSLLCMITILVELNIFHSYDVKLPEGNCCHISKSMEHIWQTLVCCNISEAVEHESYFCLGQIIRHK